MPNLARILVNSEIKTSLFVFVLLFGTMAWSIAGWHEEKGLSFEQIKELRAEIAAHEALLTGYAHDVAAGTVEWERDRASFARAQLDETLFGDRVVRIDGDDHGNVVFLLDGRWLREDAAGYEAGFAWRKEGSGLPGEIRREERLLGSWWYFVRDPE